MAGQTQITAQDGTASSRPGVKLVKLLIVLIGVHSCILGALMLFAPEFMMRILGFSEPGPRFFPSQSGIFLLIIGIYYLLALVYPAFEITIPLSKSFAVLFLTVHALFLSAPPIIWAADLGDLLMLAAFVGALFWRNRHLSASEKVPGMLAFLNSYRHPGRLR